MKNTGKPYKITCLSGQDHWFDWIILSKPFLSDRLGLKGTLCTKFHCNPLIGSWDFVWSVSETREALVERLSQCLGCALCYLDLKVCTVLAGPGSSLWCNKISYNLNFYVGKRAFYNLYGSRRRSRRIKFGHDQNNWTSYTNKLHHFTTVFYLIVIKYCTARCPCKFLWSTNSRTHWLTVVVLAKSSSFQISRRFVKTSRSLFKMAVSARRHTFLVFHCYNGFTNQII